MLATSTPMSGLSFLSSTLMDMSTLGTLTPTGERTVNPTELAALVLITAEMPLLDGEEKDHLAALALTPTEELLLGLPLR